MPLQEPQVARIPSQHRLSTSNTPSLNVPNRHATSRQHSHSVSLGTFNSTHRVTRRKSMTSGANLAVMAAVIKDMDNTDLSASDPSQRRSLVTKPSNSQPLGPNDDRYAVGRDQSQERVVEAGDNIEDMDSGVSHGHASPESMTKPRARRASEGASKHEGKRGSGELRCEKCGKGYKHSSCLTKHLSVSLYSLYPYTFSSRQISLDSSNETCIWHTKYSLRRACIDNEI